MAEAEIGLIGLGTMGSSLALNIAEKGHKIAVFNRTVSRVDEFKAEAGELADRIVPCHSMEELAKAIRPPRPIIVMVLAGKPVDEQIAALREVLSANDIIIDAGNADFNDTRRRFAELEGSGLTFIGMGVSGGEEGARHGPSIMVGGTEQSWKRVENVLTAISAKYEGEPCAAWLGTDGAGHFVKTIHNGIEYADMQMIAEIYGVLRDGLGLKAKEIAPVFAKWNKGRLNSYLIEITAKVLEASDPKTKKPVVNIILDRAGQKGTGKWSAIEAQKLGVPATAIEAAVAARVISSMKASVRLPKRPMAKPKKPKLEISQICPAEGSRTGALRRQDRRLRARLRRHGRRLEDVWLEPAVADDLENLACRLHHPLAVSRPDRRVLLAVDAGKSFDGPGLHRHDEEGASVASAHRCARRRGRSSRTGTVVGLGLFRRLSPGPRHIEPDPGPTRFLRRARF